MKNRLQYLQELSKLRQDECYKTWQALGSVVVNNNTKVYLAGTLFIVNLEDTREFILDGQDLDYEECSGLEVDGENEDGFTGSNIIDGAMVYCVSDYIVDDKHFPAINWADATINEVESSVQVYQGVNLPHFKVILSKEQVDRVKTPTIDPDFIPFQNAQIKTSEIEISDDELQIILAECGCPFVRIDELEYTRDVILNIAIKPALQEYYKFFPLVEERDLGTYGGNQQFWFELPPYGYNAVVYYTVGAIGNSQGRSLSPFAFFTSEILGGGIPGGGTGMFGRSLTYRKPVPGFTGGAGAQDAMLQALEARQGMINKFRREKIKRVKKDGKMFMTGFSTLGGALCAKIFKWSPDWDLINLEDLPQVRALCTAKILRNIGMLRSMVKTDTPGNIDFSMWLQRADTIEDKVYQYWNATTENLSWTPTRGGL